MENKPMTVGKEAILAKCCKNYKKTVEKDEKPLYNLQLNGHEALLAMDEYAASLRKERDALKEELSYRNKVVDVSLKSALSIATERDQLQSSNEAKEKRIEELSEALTNTEKAYEIMRDKSEYLKQRCEAAEEHITVLCNHPKGKITTAAWNKWQALKNKTQ